MADADSLTKLFIKDKAVFADAFNYFLYDGEQVIKPDQLSEADTTEVVVPYGEDETGLKIQPVQKIRDSFYSVMTTDRKVYMLCGIENQQQPHNAMPVRNALYDIMEYTAQVYEAAKAHRAAGNHGTGSDFLSGFHAGDRLVPVYTLVIYWGPDKWDAPKSLFEMLDIEDGNYTGLNDWKLNLITPDELAEDDVSKFSSDLGKALVYIKNMRDLDKIEELTTDSRFRTLRTDTVLMLNEIMDEDFPISEKEEMTDMNRAYSRIEERGGIRSVIVVLRDMQIPDDVIIEKIMAQFNLTEEEATAYMEKESA